MRVTDRPLQHSPWPQNQAKTDKPGDQSTNRLIAIAFAAMVAISAIYLAINGVT